jgi:hypothetical protein
MPFLNVNLMTEEYPIELNHPIYPHDARSSSNSNWIIGLLLPQPAATQI